MSGATLPARIRRLTPARATLFGAALLVGFELLLVSTYAAARDVRITNPLVLVYPFLWIDASLVALLRTPPATGSTRQQSVAAGVAVGYFLVLGYFGGLYGIGNGMVPLHVTWALPPGYSPALIYDGPVLRVILEPYKVLGYFTLAYLVYTTVVEATGAAFSGVVGLFSCVSCSWPIVGTLLTTLFGGSSAIAAFALSRSYGLSTLVFLSAIALLYYRPVLRTRFG